MREAHLMKLVFTKYAVFFFFNWIYQNSASKKKKLDLLSKEQNL